MEAERDRGTSRMKGGGDMGGGHGGWGDKKGTAETRAKMSQVGASYHTGAFKSKGCSY